MKVEQEYIRCGARVYVAALDVHRAKLFGRCEARNGMASFDQLVEQVMTYAPYRTAPSGSFGSSATAPPIAANAALPGSKAGTPI
jgi:hypothetical protein